VCQSCSLTSSAEAMAAIGCNDCVWKFFDVQLVTEWSKTFGEYAEFLKNPFRAVAPADLIKVNHGGDDGVGAWSALSIFGGIVYAVLGLIISIALTAGMVGAPMGQFIMNFIMQIITVLLVANIGWFSIVKRPAVAKPDGGAAESLPCCCLIFCCVSCKCVPLAYAVVVWIIALVLIIQPLQAIGLCGACFLFIVPPLIYGFFMIFFGISAFKIWKEVFKGEKPNIVGPAVATGGAQTTVDPIGKVDEDTKDPEKGTAQPADAALGESKQYA